LVINNNQFFASQAQFKIECLEDTVDANDVKVEVVGPSGKVEARFNMNSAGGQGSCTPIEVGMYQVSGFLPIPFKNNHFFSALRLL
jgi:hypothetical protein